MNKNKSIIISFSLPPTFVDRVRKIAKDNDISMSEVVRNAIKLYELEEERGRYGRYGGTQVGKAKITRLMRMEQREKNLKMIRSFSPAELEAHLITIGYFPPEGIDGRNEFAGVYCRHKITDNKDYVQAYIHTADGTESYRNLIFDLDNLIADLDKQNKI